MALFESKVLHFNMGSGGNRSVQLYERRTLSRLKIDAAILQKDAVILKKNAGGFLWIVRWLAAAHLSNLQPATGSPAGAYRFSGQF